MFKWLLCWLFGHEKRWVVTRTIVGWSCERCGDIAAYPYTLLSPPPYRPPNLYDDIYYRCGPGFQPLPPYWYVRGERLI